MKRLASLIIAMCIMLPACLASSLSGNVATKAYEDLLKDLKYTFLLCEFDEALCICEEIEALNLKNPPRYNEVISVKNYAAGRLEISKHNPDYSVALKLFSQSLPDFPFGDWMFDGAEKTEQLKNYCEGMRIWTGALKLDDENPRLISAIRYYFEASGYVLDSLELLKVIDNSNDERITYIETMAGVAEMGFTVYDFSGETDGYSIEYNVAGMSSSKQTIQVQKPLEEGSTLFTIYGLIPDTGYSMTVTPTRKQVKSGAAYNLEFATGQYGEEGSQVKPAFTNGEEQVFVIRYLRSKKSDRYLGEIKNGIADPATYSLVGDSLESTATSSGNGHYGYIFFTRLFQGKRNYKDVEALVVVRGIAEDNEGNTQVLTCAEKAIISFSAGYAKLAIYVDDMLTSIRNELGCWPDKILFDVYIDDLLVLRKVLPVE